MKDTIDALELLKSQHDEVDELIAEIEDSDDGEEKLELFQELADKLAAHATIEEKLFYPSVMTDQTESQLLESTEEHLQMKRMLADMLAMEPSDDRFDAKLAVLKEEVRHHARDEEEGKLFKEVRRMMDKDQLAALGNELMAMFEDLMEQEPRMEVPSQTAEAADLESAML
jgi:Hemerythrin HHE cation binding domain